MLEIKNVHKSFGKKTVLDDVNLTVDSSSVCGLVGYNGAGKTTLLKIIASVYSADEGVTLIDGRSTVTDDDVRRKMFYVADDLWFPSHANLKYMADFCSHLYDNFSRETYNRLLSIVGLNEKSRLSSFSKGMRRQAAVILALASRPDVLLIDESFDGLDPQKRDLVKKLLMEYIAETDGSVLISSHNIRELADLCDRIALMDGAKIRLDISSDELTRGKYKIRLIPAEGTEDAVFAAGITGPKKDGRMITGFITDASGADEKITALSPLMYEKFPMTLEEVLLNEMGGNDYDFKDLF